MVKITEPKKMAELIEAKFQSCWKLIETISWLVAGDLTVMEVANKLRVGENNSDREEDEYGSAVVLGVHADHGRASDDLWDWMRVKADI